MGTCDLERPQQIAALDEPCNDDVPCAHGLYCVGRYDPTQPQTCVPLPKRGEPCATLCAELGDNCDSTTKLCEDSSVRGEGCMDDSDCTDYYSCDPDNRCQTGFWQLLADGSACQLDGTDPECRSGRCDDNGLCGPRPACY
jgi:hypothetical protein